MASGEVQGLSFLTKEGQTFVCSNLSKIMKHLLVAQCLVTLTLLLYVPALPK